MKKTLLAMFAASALVLSATNVFAAELKQDMQALASNIQVVQKTTDIAELKTALNNMRAAAMDAKKSTPPKLAGKPADSAEIKDFHNTLDTLIGQIDGAIKLANEGKMKEAQAAAAGFVETRNGAHKKFR